MRVWHSENGKLLYDRENDIWTFYEFEGYNRVITIIPWSDTPKKALIEIMIKTKTERTENEIIIELFGIRDDEYFYNAVIPSNYEEKIKKICETLLKIQTAAESYCLGTPLETSIKEIMEEWNYKTVHVYYGTGLCFGLTKGIFGRIKKVFKIPNRALKYPGTRLDADI